MVKYIKRKTDNKFLQSFESNVWVENVSEAFNMTYRECKTIKESLLLSYTEEQLVEIVDFKKYKEISEEEKQELLELLKK